MPVAHCKSEEYGAVPYEGPVTHSAAITDTNSETTETCYSPGAVVVEDGSFTASPGTELKSPISDDVTLSINLSTNEANDTSPHIISPQSVVSSEASYPYNVMSSSSLGGNSNVSSVKSGNQSDDVPYELSALSYARSTPPPRLNFRKRRSRGTPKDSPIVKEFVSDTNENPPAKLAKVESDLESEETQQNDVNTKESQTDAMVIIEDGLPENLDPEDTVIKVALSRSRSEPSLSPSEKHVTFMARDSYMSEEDENQTTPITSPAKKRLSRTRRPFASKRPIDANKITDSLKLLRLRFGIDAPLEPNLEIDEETEERNENESGETEEKKENKKPKGKRLAGRIKESFLSHVRDSPMRSRKLKTASHSILDAEAEVSLDDVEKSASDDNYSTMALKGSPTPTRASVSQEKDVKSPAKKPKEHDSPVMHKKPFFTFGLWNKKKQKTENIDEAKDSSSDRTELPEFIPPKPVQQTYFQTLGRMGKMSPAIANISTKYHLYSSDSAVNRMHTSLVEGPVAEKNLQSKLDSSLFITTFQGYAETERMKRERIGSDASQKSAPLHFSVATTDVSQPVTSASSDSQHEGEAVSPENKETTPREGTASCSPDLLKHSSVLSKEEDVSHTEQEDVSCPILEVSSAFYAPHEGDQNKPKVKRTTKSTNVALNEDVKFDEKKKPNKKKKKLSKSKGIGHQLRKIFTPHKKSASDEGFEGDNSSSDEDESYVNEYKIKAEEKRSKLLAISEPIASNIVKEVQSPDSTGISKSAVVLQSVSSPVIDNSDEQVTRDPQEVEPDSKEMASDSQEVAHNSQDVTADLDSNEVAHDVQEVPDEVGCNSSQNNSNHDDQADAMLSLQNEVLKALEKSKEIFKDDLPQELQNISIENLAPCIRRKDRSTRVVHLSGSSGDSGVPEINRVKAVLYEDDRANLNFPKRKPLLDEMEIDPSDIPESTNTTKGPRRVIPTKIGRRVVPTQVPRFDSMQVDVKDEENDDVFEGNSKSNEPLQEIQGNRKAMNNDEFNPTVAMTYNVCEAPTKIYDPYSSLDKFYKDQKKVDNMDVVEQTPEKKKKGKETEKMDTDHIEILNQEKYEKLMEFSDGEGDKENMSQGSSANKKNKWSRSNSAPPNEMMKSANCEPKKFDRYLSANLDINDSSLDKWDLMKSILEDAENIYFREFGTSNLTTPSPSQTSQDRAMRPFNYDESLSVGSCSSTDSASETEACAGVHQKYTEDGNRVIAKLSRGLSGSSDSQSEGCHKRKQDEVDTPTKHGVSSKVRVSASESSGGPPKPKRVLTPHLQ